MAGQVLNFERLRDEELSILSHDDELDILDLFESVISSSPEPNIEELSQRLTDGLVRLAPGKSFREQTLPMSTWWALNRIAGCIPHTHYGQEVLASTVRKLNEVEGWRALPDIWIQMRETWNSMPSWKPGCDDSEHVFTLEEWLNLNSFAARLYDGPCGSLFDSFAVSAMSTGLEGERDGDHDRSTPENCLQVACEWAVQGGRRLMQESLQSTYANPLEKLESRYWSPYSIGPLFTGSRGFTLERWGFWKRRLYELQEDKSYSETTYELIDEAIEAMSIIEEELTRVFHE
ncbi:hypothetical protein F5B20DRAFT_293940 [Whalleya microplaca]|nr:hypothetical protein F5B20DRAFT_293940 [Whalleya microplaca]